MEPERCRCTAEDFPHIHESYKVDVYRTKFSTAESRYFRTLKDACEWFWTNERRYCVLIFKDINGDWLAL